ncbi:M1 family metallopeptidase [Luteibaculum oceani]|uniref:M1 family metallopeptidase n=1 Tax=Luteibaculum oceani TaxID=1294296 RepID=A0A5C6UVZ7_9FLAO|nr:M1 family metallopeptidase [Luteibaculum oceani]TXC77139.1 M1 family metallopeptidase [Luteibaculum oceani]
MRLKNLTIFGLSIFLVLGLASQEKVTNSFQQLGTALPTPNTYRNAAGAPGHEYWQQRADYSMEIKLDEAKQRIYGNEEITYYNQSPDALEYLWIQLDQNVRAKDSDTYKTSTSSINSKESFASIKNMEPWFDGGFKIDWVRDENGGDMKYTINRTMMRVDLDQPLKPGEKIRLNIKWWYNINDRMKIGGRSGMEYFEEDDNYLFTIAQFYPRMCLYTDYEGWQNKQFLGRGEFTLTFGNYDVRITVPADHVLGATGMLQNVDEVLTSTQKERWKKAQQSTVEPVMIVTEKEARAAEKSKSSSTKTWHYKAENVRDFAFATSRKFLWDAMAVKFGDRTVMAMSYYPKEGNPLWEKYSTKVVAHTLNVYSKHTFDYPYPAAISVHSKQIGMEYPMICFNYGRPEKDGTYSERMKYGMIGVIIHEVGHNYFPMIVNSDERQWTWMDEGLNTFLQYLTEQEFQRDYPSRRGPASKIVDYMSGSKDRISPIMTNSESIFQFGNNAYGKPATALNILRETILGRELFDFAFKTYAQRWMFKHPEPADFFRTMEDASGTDLDWFWRAWFYETDHVDIALEDVKWYQINSKNPSKEYAFEQSKGEDYDISKERNKKDLETVYIERDKGLEDFYTQVDYKKPNKLDEEEYKKYLSGLDAEQKEMLNSKDNFYELKFRNIGGIPMPIILDFKFKDGSVESRTLPAEIWRFDSEVITKVFIFDKELKEVIVDPRLQTADTDVENNYWPKRVLPSKFDLYEYNRSSENEMQRYKRAGKKW